MNEQSRKPWWKRKRWIAETAVWLAVWLVGYIPASMIMITVVSPAYETAAGLLFLVCYGVIGGIGVMFCLRCPRCGALPRFPMSFVHAANRTCHRCGFNLAES